jgi:hypothetical protein
MATYGLLLVLLVLLLVLYVAGFRVLALLLLLALLVLWLSWRSDGSAIQGLPSAPVVVPSDGGLYPDGHDGSGMALH